MSVPIVARMLIIPITMITAVMMIAIIQMAMVICY